MLNFHIKDLKSENEHLREQRESLTTEIDQMRKNYFFDLANYKSNSAQRQRQQKEIKMYLKQEEGIQV